MDGNPKQRCLQLCGSWQGDLHLFPTHACVAPVSCMANQWTALIFSTDGRISLPKFSSAAPMTSWSSLSGSPSAVSRCDPLPGSYRVGLHGLRRSNCYRLVFTEINCVLCLCTVNLWIFQLLRCIPISDLSTNAQHEVERRCGWLHSYLKTVGAV